MQSDADNVMTLIKQARKLARTEPETAYATARQALTLCQEQELSADLQAESLRVLARIAFESGHTVESAQAERMLEELLPACSPLVQAGCKSNIGWIAYLKSDLHRALCYTTEALATLITLGDAEGELWSRNNLAAIYNSLGFADRALALYRENRDRSRECGNRLLEGGALLNIGILLNKQEDYSGALQVCRESLPLMDVGQDDYARIMTRSQIIEALLGLRRYDEALLRSEELLTLPQPLPIAAALVQFERARVFRRRQEFTLALKAVEAGLSKTYTLGEEHLLLLCEKAEALEGLGMTPEAAMIIDVVLGEQVRLGLRGNRLATLEIAARIAERRKRYKQAVQYHNLIRAYERERQAQTSEYQRVLFSVELELEQAKREAEHERSRNATLAEAASRDGMTGLYNHATFQHHLQEMLDNERLVLILIDVDDFKSYNDRYGHPAGDELLTAMARLMRDYFRPEDMLARYGGEEFGVLLSGYDRETAITLVERLRLAIANHSFPHSTVTISVGITFAPPMPRDARVMLETADRALYRAKHSGKNRVVVADSYK